LFVTENPLINSPKNILKVGRDFFVLFRARNDETFQQDQHDSHVRSASRARKP